MKKRDIFLYFASLIAVPLLALIVAGFGYIDMGTWRAPIGFSLSAGLFGYSLVIMYHYWPPR